MKLFEVILFENASPKLKSSKSEQTAAVKYFKALLKSNKIDVINASQSRHGPHIRASMGNEKKAQKIWTTLKHSNGKPANVLFTSVNYTISGAYVTYKIIVREQIKDNKGKVIIKSGTEFHFVNAISQKGIIKQKDLTPDRLGCGGRTFKVSSYEKEIKALADSRLKHGKQVNGYLMYILKQSGLNKLKLDPKMAEGLTKADLNMVAKDFGEISGAYWYAKIHAKGAKKIRFPSASNEPLVDYEVQLKNNRWVKISAKAGTGGPPSINVVASVLKDPDSGIDLRGERGAAAKSIISIQENSVVQGIIDTNKFMKTPGYKAAKKLLGNSINSRESVQEWMSRFKSWPALKKALTPVYSSMNRAASDKIGNRIFDQGLKRDGLLLSPMGYHVVDQINAKDVFVNLLNDVLRTIKVDQLYMDLNPTGIKYQVKPFSEGNFSFHYNSNAGDPGLKKMSFKMSKK